VAAAIPTSHGVLGMGDRRLEPNQEKAEAQSGGSNPLPCRQAFAEQQIAKRDCYEQFSQSKQRGLHAANVFHSEKSSSLEKKVTAVSPNTGSQGAFSGGRLRSKRR